MTEQMVMDWAGKLQTGIGATDTQLNVTSITSNNGSGIVLPSGSNGFRIRITDGVNEEWIHVRSRTNQTLTWGSSDRGETTGTPGTGLSWSAGVTIEAVPTAAGLADWLADNVRGGYDYEVYWDGVATCVAKDLRHGGILYTASEAGSLINKLGQDSMLMLPRGSESLNTVGCSIILTCRGTDNSAIPVKSTDFVGKAMASGTSGQCDGTKNFVDTVFGAVGSGFSATPSFLNRLIFINAGDNKGTDTKEHISRITAITDNNTIVMQAAADRTATGLSWCIPSIMGVKLYAMSAGMRNVGNEHPDIGATVLQAQGTGWGGDTTSNAGAVVDYRNSVSWNGIAFGSMNFEMHGVGVDPGNLADFAVVGYGYGLGGLCRMVNCMFFVGTVGGFGLGNVYDFGGNSDTIFVNCQVADAPPAVSTTVATTRTLPGNLVLASISNLPKSGYGEVVSSKGTQLVFWTGITTSTKTLTGCIGGIGNVAVGASFKFYAYGVCINLGDQWNFTGCNIATDGRAVLINVQNAVRVTINGGHYGGGGGGPVFVVPSGKHVAIGDMYIDNIRGARGGIWIVPITGAGVEDFVVSPGTYFHIQEDQATPFCLDGANASASSFMFKISGQSTGNNPDGVTLFGSVGFVRYCNGWPTGRGVVYADINAQNTQALFFNETGTNAVPDYIDSTTVNVATGAGAGNLLAIPWKPGGGPTSGLPDPTAFGDGAYFDDTTRKRMLRSDNSIWRSIMGDAPAITTSGATDYTPNLANGKQFIRNASASHQIVNPTNGLAGDRLTVTIHTTSVGVTITWDTLYKFDHGTWSTPANGNSIRVEFLFDGTNWRSTGAPSNSF